MTTPAVRTPARGPRSRTDPALTAAGVLLLALAALPVDRARVGAAETEVFRVLNDTTVLPFWLVWPVMQLGNLLVVPAAAGLAAGRRRW